MSEDFETFEVTDYTVTSKGQVCIDKIDAFWSALNALPDICIDLYLEDVTRNQDLQDMERISRIMSCEGNASTNLQSEVGTKKLDALVKRGLLSKTVKVVKVED